MKKYIFISLFILILLLGVSVYSFFKFTPSLLANEIQSRCENCEITIGSSALDWNRGICLKDIKFKVGDPKISLVEGHLFRLCGQGDVMEFFKGKYNFYDLSIYNPSIKMTETPLASQMEDDGKTKIPDFIVKNIYLQDGDFTYVSKAENGIGQIVIENIRITIDQISSLNAHKDSYSTAVGTGKIAGGQVELRLKSKIFKTPYESILLAKVNNHQLEPLNRYFEPVYGITLNGKILDGDSRIEQKGKHLKSKSRFDYASIEVDFKKTKERSGWEAFFMDLGVDLAMCEENINKKERKKYQTAEHKKADGSIVSFFLMGMLQSAIKVVCL